MTIWKYTLNSQTVQEVQMPQGAEILHAGVQHNEINIWVMVDLDAQNEVRKIAVYGTGHSMLKNSHKYIGTVQLAGGTFIFHVFEIID